MEHLLPILGILIAIATPLTGAFYAWFRRLSKCIEKNNRRGWRQSKALIILANRLDDIYERKHGDKVNLGPEIEEILKDSNGDL